MTPRRNEAKSPKGLEGTLEPGGLKGLQPTPKAPQQP